MGLLAKSAEEVEFERGEDDHHALECCTGEQIHKHVEDPESAEVGRRRETSFYHDTVRRICNRLDEIYRSDENAKIVDPKCDLDRVAQLINEGESKDALKVVIKSSASINDVLKLSAEALDRAGGVSPKTTEKLKLVDYAGMCAKYAATQNTSIVSFVDSVLYEALLDGKIFPSDFTDTYESLEEFESEVAEDRETVNINAKRFLRLLTKTLVPLTSVVLKLFAVIGLTVFCISPITAALLCASAFTLDTVNEIAKSKMVLDMFEGFMCATASGERLNDVLSNRYVTLVSEVLLHEAVSGTINVCHSVSKGIFFKK